MNTNLIVLFVALAILVYYFNGLRENFDADDVKQEDIKINPLLYDRKTGIAMAGSEFIGLPDVVEPAWGNDTYGLTGQYANEGDADLMGLNYNMCSKSCCSKQFPPPFALDHDSAVCGVKDKLVASDYMCNNSWQDSGCVCMTDEQKSFLAHRGGNVNSK